MSVSTERHPDDSTGGANGDPAGASSPPTTPARHGRARHARTNASLTSSSASTSIDMPYSTDRLPRRTSVPNEASRVFQATGFDPFGTEPDTLFRSLTVKEVEAYERAVRSIALGKQEELRALVGQRYEDLLGTANTIIDMAGSSSQLAQRLDELSQGIRSAALDDDKGESSKKANRRKSFLPTQHLPAVPDVDASSLQQEAIYVLGASLRLIMDAPEYVWKSIEKGKTLQAAWAFMLTRATWWDLIDTAPLSDTDTQSALTTDGEEGIGSASEAVSLLKVNVKKIFPFIEKQWQSMLPMRKQVVHRAVALLSDADIESMAVVDQLAALMLIDGTKLDQAVHLLLSQRLTAMRRMVHRRKAGHTSHHRGERRQGTTSREFEAAHEAEQDRAAQASQTIAQLVTLFARTLQHAVQIFVLPPKAGATSSSRPLLLDLLTTIIDPANFITSANPSTSPTSERTSLLPHPTGNSDGPTARQSAAALRALRRRSSHGLPTTEATAEVAPEAAPNHSRAEQNRPLRVSTISVIQALPSARVLLRLLPPSLWSFAPFLDLESQDSKAPGQVLAELSSWSAKAREIIIGASGSTAPDTLRSLLSELSDVSELAVIRRSLRLAIHRVRRIVSRKLVGAEGSKDERHQEAETMVHAELQQLEEAVDSILQERLVHLMEQKLQRAGQELLSNTEQVVASLQPGSKPQDDASLRVDPPLVALFHSIEAEAASGSSRSADEVASPTKASHTFAATLQDHVSGRSQQVDRLASLYEIPLATLSAEVHLYQRELEADERFAEASSSIRARFDSILASSRAEVEKGLTDMLDQAQPTSETSVATSVSISTSLVMRLIAVLATGTWTKEASTKSRQPIKAALERIWRPQLEQRISAVLKGSTASHASLDASESSESSESSVSTSMLCALAMLSESIVQLGPALAGAELAQQVRSILDGVATSEGASANDTVALRALLACDAASLSKHIATDASLHRNRLALSPLVLALATTATASQQDSVTTGMVLSRAEPASATGQVKPILTLTRKKVERFSPLPVR
ncbi:uncharacterized protein UTRI_01650 [Ustilago trichophora]|uniref:Conserved oligomeric Golgi complex subunit 1 n=1 Tax=Ustilago trichophora TaxID=86804 RepID=A0A5C3DXP6_9BASI|nr:uncharacterized protein UTRI_01650 [Ustilago trichophora]